MSHGKLSNKKTTEKYICAIQWSAVNSSEGLRKQKLFLEH